MDEILRDLWNGRTQLRENLAPNTSAFHEVNKMLTGETAYLNSILSTEDKVHFDKYEEVNELLSEIFLEEAFVRGFRLAALLMVSVYQDKDVLPEVMKLLELNIPPRE